MNALLSRFDSMTATSAPERRRATRQKATYEAVLQSASGEKIQVTLVDVSTQGCNISSDAEWLRSGGFVSIGIAGHPLVGAIVRWVRDGSAGMEFLHPIPDERREWHEILETQF